ncbi:phosphoribosylformylglycinamidine synthase [Paludibacter sp.]
MIKFFKTSPQNLYAVKSATTLSDNDIQKLTWLFEGAEALDKPTIDGQFIGPRREMITPWSTNAVEITQNMGVAGIIRIEEFRFVKPDSKSEIDYDPMLEALYSSLNQDIFAIDKQPDPIIYIEDIAAYNEQEGLALSQDEILYLNEVSEKIGRKLSDSEVFGFSQVNSEHCRHKIFNGQFIIDGEEKPDSLFSLIRRTSKENPNHLVSAYKDNVSFNAGPEIEQFAPQSGDKADFFGTKKIETVLSMKAETHNFPTTVEPFNGGATGSGGEIRDRLGGGKASLPSAGISVYMTAYPRNKAESINKIKVDVKPWEDKINPRKWLYQTPEQILIKASNGASDFGNKYGQPLICGSLLTFEHEENNKKFGYDKVIMLAGGIGYGNRKDALKGTPEVGDKMVLMGGDNYRIGMGGGAVSSVDTGHYDNAVELNAVQRSNPEMQKRVANVIRTLAESDANPIVSIHDHGAGGHLNCLSELVETTGGKIDMSKLPVGDPTLSAKEIVGNESQERMGLLIKAKDIELVQKIAERERAPMYIIGEATGDMNFVFEQADGQRPIDIKLEYMFGKPPKTVMKDVTVEEKYTSFEISDDNLQTYLKNVLQMESVACKDWLTNKVDRSVTGLVARQQCLGEIQLPLSDLGVVALDYRGKFGIASAIGHAPMVAMIDPAAGSVMAVAEALTNIVWAPLSDGIKSVSLSANWMWPCKNQGEDARLYEAVEACSDFVVDLGINIPTGKDSLSMTQKYGDEKVFSPGTVIISASGEVSDVKKVVSQVLVKDENTVVYHIDFSFDKQKLGGSVLAQTLNKLGDEVPTVQDTDYFKSAFAAIQELVNEGLILSGHDISEGGMITALLEMCFGNNSGGLSVDLSNFAGDSLVTNLFAENPGVLIQVKDTKAVEKILNTYEIGFVKVATPIKDRRIDIQKKKVSYTFSINELRDIWYHSSYLLDRKQSGEECAVQRFENYKAQPLEVKFNDNFTGKLSQFNLTQDRKPSGIKAAIIREKGTNGDREMAYSLYLAGFDVKDVHMTDLVSGRENLEDVNMIVFCGGFSNSDVFGSAKGWAGAFLYNEKARIALENFYKREDTLSLGVCNGCQLMVELNLIKQKDDNKVKMSFNDSGKFDSGFVGITISDNQSVMLGSLSGSKLAAWFAHGEGKFVLPLEESKYHIAAKYSYDGFPANPNGSAYSTAAIASADGRHLAMMPHLERAIFPWEWAYYPSSRKESDEITPWVEAFVNAKQWIENIKKK